MIFFYLLFYYLLIFFFISFFFKKHFFSNFNNLVWLILIFFPVLLINIILFKLFFFFNVFIFSFNVFLYSFNVFIGFYLKNLDICHLKYTISRIRSLVYFEPEEKFEFPLLMHEINVLTSWTTRAFICFCPNIPCYFYN